jgi:poly-gamma-glutamate synthesis protein (capsule biosynthesis protein)
MMDALDNEAQTKGWVLRMQLTRDGVQSWGTILANINPQGIPSPAPHAKTPCWNKKNNQITTCDYQELIKN